MPDSMSYDALTYGFRGVNLWFLKRGRGQRTEGTEDFKLFTRTYMRRCTQSVPRKPLSPMSLSNISGDGETRFESVLFL